MQNARKFQRIQFVVYLTFGRGNHAVYRNLRASLIDGSLCCLQGASALGVININWSRLGRVAQSRIRRVASASGVEGAHNLTDQVRGREGIFHGLKCMVTTVLS